MKLTEMVGRKCIARVSTGMPYQGTYLGRDEHGYWLETEEDEGASAELLFFPWERIDSFTFLKIPA